jgi:predicted dehydrogenase
MTTRLADAEDLVRRVRDSGCVFQVGYMKRFNPAYAALRSLMPALDDILLVNVKLVMGSDKGAVVFPPLEDTAAPGAPSTWHGDVLKTGGALLPHSGSHLLDLVRHLFGEPTALRAHLTCDERGAEYAVDACIEMEAVPPVHFQLAATKIPRLGFTTDSWEENVEVTARNGRIRSSAPNWEGTTLPQVWSHMKDDMCEKRIFVDNTDQWSEQMACFVESVQKGHTLGPSVVDGYRVDKLIHGVFESARENKRVVLDWVF